MGPPLSIVHEPSLAPVASAAAPRRSLPSGRIDLLFILCDLAIVVGAGLVGSIAFAMLAHGEAGDVASQAGLGLIAGVAYALAAHHFGLYRLESLLRHQPDDTPVSASWAFAVLMVAITLFLLKMGPEVSRGSTLALGLVGWIALVGWRRLAKRRLRSALADGTISGRRAVLIGTADELAQFGWRDLLVRYGIAEVDRITLPPDDGTVHVSRAQRAAVERAVARIRTSFDETVDSIVVALPWTSTAQLEVVMEELRSVPLAVWLLPDRAVSTVLQRQAGPCRHAYLVETQRAPLTALEQTVKRVVDVGIAATALLVLSPLMLATAVAIKLESPGPVLFRQRRHGFNGRPFLIYKFRTMTVMEDGATVVQAQVADPRVTRLGAVLRRTSIDELPQLFNVLRGEMSIVGPRPHAIAHDEYYGKMIANYAFRHHMKPGITGWAQVHGFRGGTPRLELMQQRVALDLWYVANWSVWIDLQVMVRTVVEVLRQRNAF
ncbi:undecaprenyl-phosphate glucose phosphotransferase [Rhodoplanes azumiensis]|uniref:Undecaprenyl-phosphate glucose phosphotransferase n=1 Tax=Rhodoplanes azumiensis TaxID=1897628 RepID=A0ABW5ALA9_9BRAD